MTKTLAIKTVCTATVHETWTFWVPDDYVVPNDYYDLLDHLHGGQVPDVTFVSVTDEVDDERDREIDKIEFVP